MNLPFSADNQAMLAALAAFVALFLFSMGAIRILRQRSYRKEMVTRIRGGGTASTTTPEADADGAGSKGGSWIARMFGKIGRRASAPEASGYSPAKLKFLRAGIRDENAPAVHWGFKIVLAVVFPAAFIVARILALGGLSNETTIAAAVSCAVSGFYLPDIWLNRRAERRRLRILESLPGAMDLLVICVEAGMGLDSAISKVAQELSIGAPELGEEFKLMNLELRAGKQRAEALKNLSARTNLDEINSLATLMIQTDKFGTSMADALRVYSEAYRTQRYQRAEEVAAKLPVKMAIPLVFFIFPSIFLIVLGPAAINIYRTLIKDVLAR
jgi:tight adherence protein C